MPFTKKHLLPSGLSTAVLATTITIFSATAAYPVADGTENIEHTNQQTKAITNPAGPAVTAPNTASVTSSITSPTPTSIPTSSMALATDPAAATPPALWLADYAAMRQLNELGQGAEKEEKWAKAAAYYEQALKHAAKVPSPIGFWLEYAAIEANTKAGQIDNALRLLSKTADHGFRFPEAIKGDPLFKDLENDPRFHKAMEAIEAHASTYRSARSNPEAAKLIFDDVPRFWAAYDKAREFTYEPRMAAKFRKHYLAPATSGMIDYHWIKTGSMEQLARKISEAPDFYDGIREQTLRAVSYEPQIREGFKKLKALYHDAHFPDVTFVVGRLNSGGTAGPSGMLIGLDVWSWTEGVPLDGISPGFQKVLTSSNLDKLPYIVVHEQIHAMQSYSGKSTLLRGVLQEGSADFLAQLALPDAGVPPYFTWGYAHEELVWNRFKEDMLGTDFSNWIANNSEAIGDDWHADLGYFIGAQICKAYYDQAEDKQQAIKDLLYVNDAEAIFAKSGYANKFAK
jgi:hypothetical protein